jgi:hypothetical protein
MDYGGKGDGINANDKALQSLMKAVKAPATIYFPEGDYLFNSPINLRSGISISGSGHSTCRLIFEMENPLHLINVSGGTASDTVFVQRDIHRGEKEFRLPDEHGVMPGLFLLFDDDDDKITSEWAKFSTGQIIEITDIRNGRGFISSEIRRNYEMEYIPRLLRIEPAENVRISGFEIINLSPGETHTSNFLFHYAANCELCCTSSLKCNFSHADVRFSHRIHIHDNYFRHSHSYGGGGNGYGVTLHYATGECLVADNIFERLRHSILMQAGANGNVAAFNYSTDPHWTGVSLPSNAAGDLVLHGNYPYFNLFEHNIAQNIVIDDSHGANGPFNTFFRNRAELYGIFMNFAPPSDSQNFVGNVVTNDTPLLGLYFLNGKGHFEYGNNIKGQAKPEGSDNLSDRSLFICNEEPGYAENLPAVGYPLGAGEGSIPAYERYARGEYIICDSPDYVRKSNICDINIRKYAMSADQACRFLNNASSEYKVYSLGGEYIGGSGEIRESNLLSGSVYCCEIIHETRTGLTLLVITHR